MLECVWASEEWTVGVSPKPPPPRTAKYFCVSYEPQQDLTVDRKLQARLGDRLKTIYLYFKLQTKLFSSGLLNYTHNLRFLYLDMQ